MNTNATRQQPGLSVSEQAEREKIKQNTQPLTKVVAILSFGSLECRPIAAKLFVCMFVISQEIEKSQTFM